MVGPIMVAPLFQACVISNELIGQNSVVLLVSWYFVYN
jgi:hypothetical protein